MPATSAEPNVPALDMRQIAVSVSRQPAAMVAEAVDWTVAPGDFWVIGAPQNSGKTDFLMMAGGLSAPAGGEYHFFGQAMPIFEEARLAYRLKLGFVFDGGQLLGQLTVAENIALPLRYHGGLPLEEIERRVRQLLDVAELGPWANSTPANVGRSWRQRAGLMRALTLQPEVLLLDSPLTGLDGRHVAWWLQLLDRLWRGEAGLGGRPVTLVVTADDLRPWRGHAGQVACLADRRLLLLGDWRAAAASSVRVVQELLGRERAAIDPARGI